MRASLAVVLLAFSAAATAADLGTLFFTAKERETLERLRRGEPAERAAFSRTEPVVTGYVRRSDGKSTVFIDKQPYRSTTGRVQRLLEPRIVERYDPLPLPPEPVVHAGGKSDDAADKAIPPKRVPGVRPKSDGED